MDASRDGTRAVVDDDENGWRNVQVVENEVIFIIAMINWLIGKRYSGGECG